MAAMAIGGFLAWLPFYFSQIDIDIPDRSSPTDPQPPFFRIINSSILPIYDVLANAYWVDVSLVSPERELMYRHNLTLPYPIAEKLEPRGKRNLPVSMFCPDPSMSVKGADVQLVVLYTPKFFFWKRDYACGRFAISPDANGHPSWMIKEPLECDKLGACLASRSGENLSECIVDPGEKGIDTQVPLPNVLSAPGPDSRGSAR